MKREKLTKKRTKHQKEDKEIENEEKEEEIKENQTLSKKEMIEIKKSKKNKKSKKKSKHPKIKRFFIILFVLLLIVIIAGIIGVVAIFKTDKWAITKEQFLSDAGATIYDKNGNEIASLTGDEINKKVEIGEMGKIPDAFVAIEDERYYEHNGIDIKRTAAAILHYITSGGKTSFGGSTITQQLVKITMKDDEQSGIAGIQRKIREWSRAVQVEKMLTKEQILERYLNRIYLGSSSGLEVRGVESAANYYFNKSSKDLSIAQAAFIAGINHSPNSYNVFSQSEEIYEKAKNRTLNVVGKMKELGKITEEEYNSAVQEINDGLKYEKGNLSNGNGDITYHTAAAINQIANELSDEKDISYTEARQLAISSGYKIYTTVDASIQGYAEEVYENSSYQVKGYSSKTKDVTGQSAIVIIDPPTGQVVAEVGGLGSEENTLGLNRGISKRQAGSSFKPLATVAPGLEYKYITPATLFYDAKTTFGKNYEVKNDSSYYGITNMRNILIHSLNVPEVKLLSIMGVEKGAEFLGKIGIDIDPSNSGLSLALGSADVSPLQMAAGFAMIQNGGTYITPTFYTKVEDQNGKTVIEAKQEKTRVMSEQNAYLETSMLEGPIKNGGTASTYSSFLGNMDVAGKTGTSDNAIDRWFCGYTPYYAAACWYGNDNGYSNEVRFNSSNPASKIWFNIMKKIDGDLEAKKFTKPEGIVEARICKATGKKATSSCKDTYTEIFAEGGVPDSCDGHTTVTICKESELLATEFCTDKEERTYGYVIDTERKANWSPKQTATAAPTANCNIHTQAAKIAVPNVVGMTQETATTTLKNAGFTVKVLKDNDKNIAKGVVLKQSLTTAPKGSEITITVNDYAGGTTPPTTPATNTTTPAPAPTTNTTTPAPAPTPTTNTTTPTP